MFPTSATLLPFLLKCYTCNMINSVRRLAELFVPAQYKLNLDITKRKERKFNGSVNIEGELLQSAQEIVLHAKDLKISSATINGVSVKTNLGENDELSLSTGAAFSPGKYNIELSFDGDISDPMHGLYPCYFSESEQNKELLMTQFESHSAHEVFPCIDEPAAKATFDLTLTTEDNIAVLSNTPVVDQKTTGKTMVTIFETTPKMSTYLLAFVAGDLVYKETANRHGVKIRVYATPNHKHELNFALENAAKFLDFYNDYFELPYPLPKCDLVACPDFSAGAMENWGLVTFRESALLVNPKDFASDIKQHVATIIAHELAHQWFGNLVTMRWWDNLWLNESFANWMEYYAVDHFYPEWQLWQQYCATEQQVALARDSLASVQTVQQEVRHPDEIASLFDSAIVYAKGGSLIWMLQTYLGNEIFRDGLRLYMQRHKYSNATAEDLWQALTDVSGKNIVDFMQPWISQAGHPLIDFKVKSGTAEVSQRRFFADASQESQNNSLWHVPLLCKCAKTTEILTKKSVEFKIENADYYLLNHGGTGFYHVLYDDANLEQIAKAVSRGELSDFDRQRILTDCYALNRAGNKPTVETLKLLSHFTKETNYSVWIGMNSVINAARIIVNDDEKIKPDLRKLVSDVSREQYKRLGWEAKKDESHFDSLLRPTVLGNMAYAHDKEVTAKCLELFNSATKPENLQPDIRSIVYGVAVRTYGRPAIDKLMSWHKTTLSADERLNIVAGLSSAKDPKDIKWLLDHIISQDVKLQDAIYWFIYFIRSKHGRQAAWQWMTNNWAWITQNYGGDVDYNYFAKFSGGAFSTRQELAQYKEFFEPKLNEPALKRTILQGYEDIEIKAAWRDRDLKSVADFLKNPK